MRFIRLRVLSVLLVTLSVLICIQGQNPTGSTGKIIKRDENQRQNLTTTGLRVGTVTRIAIAGQPLMLWSSAAPDDPNRLMVCAWVSDGEHARTISSAHVTFDGGNTWMQTIVDARSDWVSEPSCAAGANGRAYFVASASDTRRGEPRHAMGSTAAYLSVDGGLTWSEPRRYPFLDWTALAIAPQRTSEQRQKVYLFANRMALGTGEMGEGTWTDGRRPLLTSIDGIRFSSPVYPQPKESPSGRGAFPLDAVTLSDGSVRALYARYPAKPEDKEWSYEVYQSDETGYAFLSQVELPPGVHWTNLLSGHMALDQTGRFRGRLYVVVPGSQDNRPTLGLATSDNGGKTWQTRLLLKAMTPSGASVGSHAAVAVNRDGLLGIEWWYHGACPTFIVSSDGGESITSTTTLGTCPSSTDTNGHAGEIERHLVVTGSSSSMGRAETKKGEVRGFDVRVKTTSLIVNQIVADSSGRFHAFWIEDRRDGDIALLTATVTSAPLPVQRIELKGMLDVSHRAVVKVINQRFVSDTATLSVDAVIENTDADVLPYPTILQFDSAESACGMADFMNLSATSEDGRAVFSVPIKPGRKELSTGERTLPVHLEIRMRGCESASLAEWAAREAKNNRYPYMNTAGYPYLLRMRFKVFARG